MSHLTGDLPTCCLRFCGSTEDHVDEETGASAAAAAAASAAAAVAAAKKAYL